MPARLYLPAPALGFEGKRPVVFYIHGGPQGQERPDFTWFSMPLIQFLTLNGLAVFVPNVRGSHGYGMDYVKRVDRDWGGLDRLDHVAGLASLEDHPRVDMNPGGRGGPLVRRLHDAHAGGDAPRAYGRPRWTCSARSTCLAFLERIPETWKPYFRIVLGHPSVIETSLSSGRRAHTCTGSPVRCS